MWDKASKAVKESNHIVLCLVVVSVSGCINCTVTSVCEWSVGRPTGEPPDGSHDESSCVCHDPIAH